MYHDGDILLCKSEGPIPTLIKWGTRSIYSHVAVIASAELGLIIEAVTEGGVRAIALENYSTPFDVYRIKPQYPFDAHKTTMFLVKMLARPYNFDSVKRLGWKMLLRRLNLARLLALKIFSRKKEASDLQKDQDYFCSELCFRAFFEGGGLDIVPQVSDAETTSPGDIASSPLLEKILIP